MNYKNFYLSIFFGTGFIAGMFYSASFGFFSLKFLASLFFTCFPLLLFYLYLKEKRKNESI